MSAETTRVLLALLLGIIAAGANVAGGLLIVKRHWNARFLKYFIALGAGFMLATAMIEMIPESVKLRGDSSSRFCRAHQRGFSFLSSRDIFSFTFSNIRLPRIFILARKLTTRKCPTRMPATRRCWDS